MAGRIRIRKKKTRYEGAGFAPAIAQAMFQTRPFLLQAQTEEEQNDSEKPDLQTQLDRADRFGHHLGEFQAFPAFRALPTTSGIQAKPWIPEEDDRKHQENPPLMAQPTGREISGKPHASPPFAMGLVQRKAMSGTPIIQRNQTGTATVTNQPVKGGAAVNSSPSASKQDDATIGLPKVANFNQAKSANDLQIFLRRLETLPALNTPTFKNMIEHYIQLASVGKEAAAKQKINDIVQYLDGLRAFQISGKVYRKMGVEGPLTEEEQKERDQLAAQAKLSVWSKVETEMPITEAEKEGGITLEASAAGTLFNGLDFGIPGGAVLKEQWDVVSKTYISNAKGIVHARVLKGINPNSVLVTTEWPKISELFTKGIVTQFVLHIFDFSDDSEFGTFNELESITIFRADDWKTLPMVNPDVDQAYVNAQNQVYAKQTPLKKKNMSEIDDKDNFDARQQQERKERFDAAQNAIKGHIEAKSKAIQEQERKERFKTAMSFFEKQQAVFQPLKKS